MQTIQEKKQRINSKGKEKGQNTNVDGKTASWEQ